MNQPAENKSNNLSKRDRGAMLFQSVINQFGQVQDEQQGEIKEIRNTLWDFRRRLRIVESRVEYISSLVRRGPIVQLECIECKGKTVMSTEEAAACDGMSICPECGNYCLLDDSQGQQDLTASGIATELNLAPVTVLQIARKNEIGRKTGKYRYFEQGDIEKIEAVMKSRKVDRRKRKPESVDIEDLEKRVTELETQVLLQELVRRSMALRANKNHIIEEALVMNKAIAVDGIEYCASGELDSQGTWNNLHVRTGNVEITPEHLNDSVIERILDGLIN